MTEVSRTFLDKIVAYVSPRAGLSRMAAKRSYEAATTGRRGKSFKNANQTGPNLEIGQALPTLRARSRHFVRNNGWANRAIDAIVGNVIGEGIRPAPKKSESAKVKKIKELWADWAGTKKCDFDGNSNFYGLQNLVMREIAEGGDCLIFIRRVTPTKSDLLPIKLQVVEGDQIDHGKDGPNEKGYTRLGVQFDTEGRKIGFWVWSKHPNDMTGLLSQTGSEFYSTDDVIHPFEILRAGQTRGVPMGVAAFMKLSDFSDYEDAQLVRQKCAAAFVAFIKTDKTGTDALESLEPGTIQYMNDGEEVTLSNPPAADGYDSYSKKILQGVAAAYGITYEMLTMDYSNVNFTSGRMAKIDITNHFKRLQYQMIVPMLCVPVWEKFMDACIMTGLATARILCTDQDWTAPRVQQIDPVKETNARIAQLGAGLTTLSECIREDGRDPEEFFAEYKAEQDLLKSLGIVLSFQPAPDPIEPTDLNADVLEPELDAKGKPVTDTNGKPKMKAKTPDLNQTADTSKDEVLAVKFGVGGTTSIVDILTNDILTDEQKKNILEVLFSIDSVASNKMLAGGKTQAQKDKEAKADNTEKK